MFIPTGDRPNPQNFTPWVNYSLIAINVFVYVAVTVPLSMAGADPDAASTREWMQMALRMTESPHTVRQALSSQTAYDMVVYAHGFKSGAMQLTDLFSSMFLHGGFMHLAGNMLFLWIYGDNVEHRLGRWNYLGVYLLAGIAAALFFGALNPDSFIPMVGASGAISGVLGLYFFLFPANEVRVFVWFFYIARTLYLKARWVLGLYVVWDNLLPMAMGTSSGVAYGAHIGGFFFGLIAGGVATKFVSRSKARDGMSKADFHMKMARHRMEQGQDISAYQHLQKAMTLDPSLSDEARALMSEIAR